MAVNDKFRRLRKTGDGSEKSRGNILQTAIAFVAAMSTTEYVTARDLMCATGMGQRQVYRWLRAAKMSKAVEVERIDDRPARYRISRVVNIKKT